MRAGVLLVVLAFGWPAADVRAFDIAGVRSGMSRQEVLQRAIRHGLNAGPDVAGNLLVWSPNGSAVDAAFGFCGDALIAYDRTVYPEAEYHALLRMLWSRHGPPSRMEVTGDMGWVMPAAGGFRLILVMHWFDGADVIRLRSFVEWETGMSALRRFRPASIGFAAPNRCGLP
jgi:hypothetical protein